MKKIGEPKGILLRKKKSKNVITFFSVPKAFKWHIGIIQTNAIKSWVRLKPKPEIILLGDAEGTKEICKQLGLIHISLSSTSQEETAPFVNDIFYKAMQGASSNFLCMVNTDIILFQDIIKTFELITHSFHRFLMISSRYNMDVEKLLDMDDETFLKSFRRQALEKKDMYPAGGTDFFIFPKRLYSSIPPFLLGRGYWDNWLMAEARRLNAPIIDVTYDVVALHQNHDYTHIPKMQKGDKNLDNVLRTKQGHHNLFLAGGQKNVYTNYDADYIVQRHTIISTLHPLFIWRILKAKARRFKNRLFQKG